MWWCPGLPMGYLRGSRSPYQGCGAAPGPPGGYRAAGKPREKDNILSCRSRSLRISSPLLFSFTVASLKHGFIYISTPGARVLPPLKGRILIAIWGARNLSQKGREHMKTHRVTGRRHGSPWIQLLTRRHEVPRETPEAERQMRQLQDATPRPVAWPAVWGEQGRSAFSASASLALTAPPWVMACVSGVAESWGLLASRKPAPPVPLPYVSYELSCSGLFTHQHLKPISPGSSPDAERCKMRGSELFITGTFRSRRRTNFLSSRWLSQASQGRHCWPSASCCLFKLAGHAAPAVGLGCPLWSCVLPHEAYRAGATLESAFDTHEAGKLPSKPTPASFHDGRHKRAPPLGPPIAMVHPLT